LAIDTNKIQYQLNFLDKYFHRLKKKQSLSKKEYTQNPDMQAIVERNFQLAIECCLNIGTHLISALPLDIAEDYASVLMRLADADIIPKDFGKKLANMAKFRNLLVHMYWEIDSEKVYFHLKNNLDDLKKFAEYIVDFLETQKKHNND